MSGAAGPGWLPFRGVEVLGPKGPKAYGGSRLIPWSRDQLLIAGQIMDNPGGGLLFATQTVGQVKAALSEVDRDRWRDLIRLLDSAEDHMVRRQFSAAREELERAREALAEGEPAQPA